jgi:tetratricopeptide (TPR) repeat protein
MKIAVRVIVVSVLSLMLLANTASAETKTLIKEYTYLAGDEDSKNSSRTISLREVKRLLLEELGTYLESTTEVQNFQINRDQIITLTAGIVQTELVEEKWDGRTYWLKAKIQADSGEVIKAIDTLRKDRQKTRELEEIRKRSDDLLKENERLRQELAMATGEKKKKDADAYGKTIKDLNATEWFERGYQFGIAERWKDALDAFTKSIELDPQYAEAYYNRGVTYRKLGNYNQAIKDYDKAVEIDPQYEEAYLNRGVVYAKLGNTKQEIRDYDKAIEINPQDANAYYNRGITYGKLGNFNQAINDFDKAIELNPQYAKAYNNRGIAYGKLGNTKQEIRDYDKAIEINPQDANAYYNRGITYGKLGNFNQARNDMKIAARLGDETAQDILRELEIAW